MIGKTAAIIGSTGMTGTYLLNLLLEDDYFSTVRVIVRRPVPKSHPKMEVKLVDFKDAESLKLALEETDIVFCCIGTTAKNVKGDLALYREIDLDIPVRTARFAKEAGCEQFIIMSSVGANINSKRFYLKLKGDMEEAVRAVGLPTTHVLRPSSLLGPRKETRAFERFFIHPLMKLFSFAVPARYKAIEGSCVAKAMVLLAKQGKPGFHVYENETIMGFCANSEKGLA